METPTNTNNINSTPNLANESVFAYDQRDDFHPDPEESFISKNCNNKMVNMLSNDKDQFLIGISIIDPNLNNETVNEIDTTVNLNSGGKTCMFGSTLNIKEIPTDLLLEGRSQCIGDAIRNTTMIEEKNCEQTIIKIIDEKKPSNNNILTFRKGDGVKKQPSIKENLLLKSSSKKKINTKLTQSKSISNIKEVSSKQQTLNKAKSKVNLSSVKGKLSGGFESQKLPEKSLKKATTTISKPTTKTPITKSQTIMSQKKTTPMKKQENLKINTTSEPKISLQEFISENVNEIFESTEFNSSFDHTMCQVWETSQNQVENEIQLINQDYILRNKTNFEDKIRRILEINKKYDYDLFKLENLVDLKDSANVNNLVYNAVSDDHLKEIQEIEREFQMIEQEEVIQMKERIRLVKEEILEKVKREKVEELKKTFSQSMKEKIIKSLTPRENSKKIDFSKINLLNSTVNTTIFNTEISLNQTNDIQTSRKSIVNKRNSLTSKTSTTTKINK
jgi:hypothetical protein